MRAPWTIRRAAGRRLRGTAAAAALAAAGALAAPASPAGAQEGAAAAAVPVHPLPRLFVTGDVCMACHNGLTTAAGEDVSIGVDWRASIMAHSSRDPYWQGSLRREVLDHPGVPAGEIEDECAMCHMPMSTFRARARGREGAVFEHLPVADAESRLDTLAVEGVSCTVCHQIEEERLGEPASFNGGFVIDTRLPWGRRPAYGPFAVDSGRVTVMHSATGFAPREAVHVQRSELCATCHTLYTRPRNERGEVVGRLPEQVPYLEWRHSAFRGEQSCQDCHMRAVEDSTPIASVLGRPRPGLSRHTFLGGNFFMLRMLNHYRDELRPHALPQELDAAARRTVEFLGARTARVSVERVEVRGGRLTADVALTNLTGHKLPTAYPSRRAWIHLTVRDGAGRVVFESGALRPDGSIAGNANDDDPRAYEPHHAVIERADQVQIYESIMVDAEGRVTTGLLKGVRFVKDNRLLPRGFDKATAHPDVAVQGRAAGDGDFTAAGDRVRYAVDVSGARGPLRVEAVLWYQPIAFRWARNLAPYDAPETRRFVRYYDSMASSSAIEVARSSASTVP